MTTNVYGSEVTSDANFVRDRMKDIICTGRDEALRRSALELQASAEVYKYGYQQQWCGVPIIRLPDDILTLQEITWDAPPGFIMETGIARDGSLLLSAGLMAMTQIEPRVLGMNIQILQHARDAILGYALDEAITLWKGDSAGPSAAKALSDFIEKCPAGQPGLLILDSDHSQSHVLGELRTLADLMSVGSLVLVADTLIEEFEIDHYPDRPWGAGNSPMTAILQSLA